MGRETSTVGAQTLARGLLAIELLAEHGPQRIPELADRLGVHRSIAYRIVRTLEERRYVIRDAAGRLELGPQLAVLARSIDEDLQSAALPHVTTLANELGMTAFVVVQDVDDVVTLVTVEPRRVHASVAQRPGTRHPLSKGAPGIALQTLLTPEEWTALGHDEPMRAEVAAARDAGYATTHDEVIPGITSIAAPVPQPRLHPHAAIAVVTVGAPDTEHVGRRVVEAAASTAADLG
ncbi:helix-turn-helix domain-containing protein [Georgenia halophila]|uniref:Helix-turn-helix domain-containing protein n=1 Tax=Georgenia halophila TaxID=620889 RepID=A0ABP8LJK0_9MICO